MEPTRDPDPVIPDPAPPAQAPPPPAAAAPPSVAATSAGAVPGTAPKADLVKRFLAQLVDGILVMIIAGIAFAVFLFVSFNVAMTVAVLIGAAYFGVRDGLDVEPLRGRSIGKKLLKLRPVRLDGRPMDLETSLRRNWMFVLSYVAALPFLGFLGTLLSAVAGLVILYECYKVITDAAGRRLGDEMAATQVVESAT